MATNNAKSANHSRAAFTNIGFFRHIIEMQPTTFACYDTFCTQHRSVFCLVLYRAQSIRKLFFGEFLRSFYTPTRKHFICVMMPVMIVTATAFFIVVMMVMVFVMIVSATAFFIMVVVVMLVVVVTATAFLIMS